MLLSSRLAWLANRPSRCGDGGIWLWSFGCRCNHSVPIDEPTAAIAGQQFSFAKLVPDLGTHPHPAAHALLILGSCDCRTTSSGNPVEPGEQLWLDLVAERFAVRSQGRLLPLHVAFPGRNQLARLFERGGKLFDPGSCRGQRLFFRFSALEACKLIIFQLLDRTLRKLHFVLDGRSLGRSGYGILLGFIAGCLLAVARDLPFLAVAQCLLAIERIRCGRRPGLHGTERGFGLRHMSR